MGSQQRCQHLKARIYMTGHRLRMVCPDCSGVFDTTMGAWGQHIWSIVRALWLRAYAGGTGKTACVVSSCPDCNYPVLDIWAKTTPDGKKVIAHVATCPKCHWVDVTLPDAEQTPNWMYDFLNALSSPLSS